MNIKLNYYQILGIDHNSDRKEIKNNYRQLSKKFHPDKNDNDDTHFILIAEAYNVVTSDNLRDEYDLNSKFGKRYNPMLELLDFEFSNTNSTSLKMKKQKDKFKVNDMIHVVVELSSFIDKIEYNRSVICSKCDGSGSTSIMDIPLNGKMGKLFDNEEMECDICDGNGTFNNNECPACHGNGYVKFGLSPCLDCRGKGVKTIKKKVTIKLEDVLDGKLKIDHYGNQLKDGRVGNLYIIIKDQLKEE